MVKKKKNKMKSRNDLYNGTRDEENFRGVSMEQCPMHQIGQRNEERTKGSWVVK